MERIRALETADLARADEVLRAAFHVSVSFQPRLQRYLTMQPDGWLVADEDDGQIVGTVGAIHYGAFAYIGLMAVRPDRQGRRLGRQLLEAVLEATARRGTACAVLDASEAGAPLYERMGFVDAGSSQEFWPADAGLEPATAAAATAPDAVHVATATPDDLGAVVRLDGALFGAERPQVWRWFFAARPERVLLARDERGALVGYVFVQDGLLGPFGARTAVVADALLHQAIALLGHPRVRLQLPEDNADGRALLLRRGFTIGRSLRHMRRGPCPDLTGWKSLYGKGSYCLG